MNITRIDAFEGYKQDITLYCKRKRNGRGLSPAVLRNFALKSAVTSKIRIQTASVQFRCCNSP